MNFEHSIEQKFEAEQVHSKGVELIPRLIDCMRNSSIHLNSYAYTHRVKSADKILGKVKRRVVDHNHSDYKVSNVTDVIGIKIISLFFEDVKTLADEVCKLILNKTEIHPNPFKAEEISEIKIYSTAPVDNLASPAARLKQHLQNHFSGEIDADNIEIVFRHDYSSLHIVFLIDAGLNTDGDSVFMPVEIQIRTVFEDAWAQIDHVLRYSKSREKHVANTRNITVASEKNLVILKQMLDACSGLSESIREELTPPFSGNRQRIVAMDGVAQFEQTSLALGIDPKVIASFKKLLVEKERLDHKNENNLADGTASYSAKFEQEISEKYSILAEDFHKFIAREEQVGGIFASNKHASESDYFLIYTATMEEAFCRSMSQIPDERTEASRTYERLAEIFPKSSIVFLRIGQSASKNGDYEKAIEAYSKSLEIFNNQRNFNSDKRGWLLTDIQLDYISNTIYRIYGYAHWRLYDVKRKAIEHLIAAWNITYDGLNDAKRPNNRIRLVNNLLSYYNYAFELREDERKIVLGELKYVDQIRELYNEFKDSLNWKVETRVHVLDTLLLSSIHIGQNEDITEIANKTMEVALMPQSIEFYGRDICDVAIRHAWACLSKVKS